MTTEPHDRAKIAWDVIGTQFDLLRASYALEIADIAASEPWAVDKIRSLAQAVKVLDAVKGQVLAIAEGARIEQHDREIAQKIAQIRPSKQRWWS